MLKEGISSVPDFTTSPGGSTADLARLLSRPVGLSLPPGGPPPDSTWSRAAGRVEPVSIEGVRELSREEVAGLPPIFSAAASGTSPLRAVQRLKVRHHEIARVMAAGLRDTEISEVLGVSLPHLSTLRRSPAFQQLLMAFMGARDAEALSMKDRLEYAAGLGLDKIQEILEGDADIPLGFLRDTAFGLLDRAGYNATTKIQSASIALSATDLAELREARDVARSEQTRIISADSQGRESARGKVIDQPAELGKGEAAAREEGAGNGFRASVSQVSEEDPQLELFPTAPQSVVQLPRAGRGGR